MPPKMITKDKLFITGLTGNGSKTLKVWTDFDNRFNGKPFPKTDQAGYEIRFWNSRKTGRKTDPEKNVHVGFLTETTVDDGVHTTVELPASEYACFDVFVTKGYDSGNEEMEKWLADYSAIYSQREFDGHEYVVECYNEKFKGGNQPDSVVEIWIPLLRFCQSCYMPMTRPEDFGTEKDGSPSVDYCCHCYQDGIFTWGTTLEEAVEENIRFWRKESDKSDDEARVRIRSIFPKLKRWAK